MRTFMIGAALFTAAHMAVIVAPKAEMSHYKATLTGAAETPPTDSKGAGALTATYDTDSKKLEWTVDYSGLTGPAIAAHFHGPVSYLGLTPEENAPIQVGTPGNLASPFHGVAKIDDTQAKDLKDGRWYFNVHSNKFVAGEIRGPVVRR